MRHVDIEWSGLEDLLKEIKKTGSLTDTEILDCIDAAVTAYTKDASMLPRPMSAISRPGYTHLVRTVSSKRNRSRNEIEAGWGKYYGPFVEHGTSKMSSRRHMGPLWNSQKERYYEMIQTEFNRKTK